MSSRLSHWDYTFGLGALPELLTLSFTIDPLRLELNSYHALQGTLIEPLVPQGTINDCACMFAASFVEYKGMQDVDCREYNTHCPLN